MQGQGREPALGGPEGQGTNGQHLRASLGPPPEAPDAHHAGGEVGLAQVRRLHRHRHRICKGGMDTLGGMQVTGRGPGGAAAGAQRAPLAPRQAGAGRRKRRAQYLAASPAGRGWRGDCASQCSRAATAALPPPSKSWSITRSPFPTPPRIVPAPCSPAAAPSAGTSCSTRALLSSRDPRSFWNMVPARRGLRGGARWWCARECACEWCVKEGVCV